MTAPDRFIITPGKMLITPLTLASWLLSFYPVALSAAENNQQVVFRDYLLNTWPDQGTIKSNVQKGTGSSCHNLSIEEAEGENGQSAQNFAAFTGAGIHYSHCR